jgi:hypothetical protein
MWCAAARDIQEYPLSLDSGVNNILAETISHVQFNFSPTSYVKFHITMASTSPTFTFSHSDVKMNKYVNNDIVM